ncbi:hypothetical protein F2Q69_00011840 [Brassica cretica]|uniref:Uncharacterized protein n=1 Tax=Brassica cretica TaxID=69181 RepID=A0A8S9R156_BRACR|nr:hypothetical protein F2Q69_00011840 [Brassica cretica]
MHGLMSYRRFGRARSLRSDRAGRTLSGDRAERTLDRYVATELVSSSVATFTSSWNRFGTPPLNNLHSHLRKARMRPDHLQNTREAELLHHPHGNTNSSWISPFGPALVFPSPVASCHLHQREDGLRCKDRENQEEKWIDSGRRIYLRINVVQETGWKGKGALPLQPYPHTDPSWPLIQTEASQPSIKSIHASPLQLAPEHQRPSFSHPSHPIYLAFMSIGSRSAGHEVVELLVQDTQEEEEVTCGSVRGGLVTIVYTSDECREDNRHARKSITRRVMQLSSRPLQTDHGVIQPKWREKQSYSRALQADHGCLESKLRYLLSAMVVKIATPHHLYKASEGFKWCVKSSHPSLFIQGSTWILNEQELGLSYLMEMARSHERREDSGRSKRRVPRRLGTLLGDSMERIKLLLAFQDGMKSGERGRH